MDNRADVRDFLVTRRAKVSPADVGLPTGGRRRVVGLRREEVAVLAGVSTEWYTRLESGHITDVSEEVLEAVADALQMADDERAHLFDLARAARRTHRRPSRRRPAPLSPRVQWMLDSVTMSAAFVRNGRLDIIAANPLARALHQPLFDSPTTKNGVANFARYFFLDDDSKDYFGEWESGAAATVALLRAEAGREPQDRQLRELVGELSTRSQDFAELWAAHDIRSHHDGTKTLIHPVVGAMSLVYQSMKLPTGRGWQELTFYTAEPGSPDEERMRLLASWAAPALPSGLPPVDPAALPAKGRSAGL